MLKRYILAGAIVLVAFVTTGAYLTHRWSTRHTADLAAVAVARTEVQRALGEAAAADVTARFASDRGDSLSRVVATLRALGQRAGKSDSAARQQFSAVVVSSPDTCKDVIRAANAALAAAAYKDTLDVARADTAEMAADSYRQSAVAAEQALVRLTVAAQHLDTAAEVVVKRARPSFLARIAPKVGVGAAAGVAPDGRPAVLPLAITLGWTFR